MDAPNEVRVVTGVLPAVLRGVHREAFRSDDGERLRIQSEASPLKITLRSFHFRYAMRGAVRPRPYFLEAIVRTRAGL